eukprot:10119912-Alexandrium_andersonii.AAC.1
MHACSHVAHGTWNHKQRRCVPAHAWFLHGCALGNTRSRWASCAKQPGRIVQRVTSQSHHTRRPPRNEDHVQLAR